MMMLDQSMSMGRFIASDRDLIQYGEGSVFGKE
jgi:hypothetical protein